MRIMRKISLVLVSTLGLISESQAAKAQEFPTRPIRLIVPGSPGGPLDLTGRTMAQAMSQILKQPVVVENHTGANGVIGTHLVAQSKPDGYTILIATGSHTANEAVVKDLPYDVKKDFTPLIQISRSYGSVMVTRPEFPPADIAALVASAKKRSAPYTYSTSGYGNVTHVGPALFAKLAGINLQDVQYKGTAASSMQDVMSGVVDMTFANPISAEPFLRAGTLKAYAVPWAKYNSRAPRTDVSIANLDDIFIFGHSNCKCLSLEVINN